MRDPGGVQRGRFACCLGGAASNTSEALTLIEVFRRRTAPAKAWDRRRWRTGRVTCCSHQQEE